MGTADNRNKQSKKKNEIQIKIPWSSYLDQCVLRHYLVSYLPQYLIFLQDIYEVKFIGIPIIIY